MELAFQTGGTERLWVSMVIQYGGTRTGGVRGRAGCVWSSLKLLVVNDESGRFGAAPRTFGNFAGWWAGGGRT
jgi:hypothetical protein